MFRCKVISLSQFRVFSAPRQYLVVPARPCTKFYEMPNRHTVINKIKLIFSGNELAWFGNDSHAPWEHFACD